MVAQLNAKLCQTNFSYMIIIISKRWGSQIFQMVLITPNMFYYIAMCTVHAFFNPTSLHQLRFLPMTVNSRLHLER